MNHPTDDFDTTHCHTEATNLAREELLRVNAYDDVVDLLQAAYSALLDASARLADSVPGNEHRKEIDELQGDVEDLEQELKDAKAGGEDVEALKKERDRAFELRDQAQDELEALKAPKRGRRKAP